jgi:hypothetical protein
MRLFYPELDIDLNIMAVTKRYMIASADVVMP